MNTNLRNGYLIIIGFLSWLFFIVLLFSVAGGVFPYVLSTITSALTAIVPITFFMMMLFTSKHREYVKQLMESKVDDIDNYVLLKFNTNWELIDYEIQESHIVSLKKDSLKNIQKNFLSIVSIGATFALLIFFYESNLVYEIIYNYFIGFFEIKDNFLLKSHIYFYILLVFFSILLIFFMVLAEFCEKNEMAFDLINRKSRIIHYIKNKNNLIKKIDNAKKKQCKLEKIVFQLINEKEKSDIQKLILILNRQKTVKKFELYKNITMLWLKRFSQTNFASLDSEEQSNERLQELRFALKFGGKLYESVLRIQITEDINPSVLQTEIKSVLDGLKKLKDNILKHKASLIMENVHSTRFYYDNNQEFLEHIDYANAALELQITDYSDVNSRVELEVQRIESGLNI